MQSLEIGANQIRMLHCCHYTLREHLARGKSLPRSPHSIQLAQQLLVQMLSGRPPLAQVPKALNACLTPTGLTPGACLHSQRP